MRAQLIIRSIRLTLLILGLAFFLAGANPAAADPPDAATPPKTQTFRFQMFVLKDDPQHIGGEVSRFLIPAGWKTDGGLLWDLSSARPAQIKLKVYDPNGPGANFIYPGAYFYFSSRGPQMRPGAKYLGRIIRQPPADQFEALKMVIAAFRPDVTNATEVETQKLPKMSQAAYNALPPAPGTRCSIQSGFVRLEYQLNGQPVQEDFSLVFRQDLNPRFGALTWSLDQITSVRGPKGQLDKYNALRDVMETSLVLNQKWNQAYGQYIVGQYKRGAQNSIQAGQAAAAQAQQAHQQEDAQQQQFENQQAAEDARNEQTAETMRDQTPWTGPDGTRVLLPTEYGHAWQDGNGQYIVSNDPSYNPNTDPNQTSSWTAMNPAPPPGQ
jgi:hypothetical protein